MGHLTFTHEGRADKRTPKHWLPLASQIAQYARKFAGRTDIIANVGPGIGGKYGTACWSPMLADLDVNTDTCLPGVAPDRVDFHNEIFQLGALPFVGAVTHEAAHARWSCWVPLTFVERTKAGREQWTQALVEVVIALEESRIEKLAVEKDPSKRDALAQCALSIVLKDFKVNNTLFGASISLALTVGRYALLSTDEIDNFRTLISPYLPLDLMPRLESLIREYHAIPAHLAKTGEPGDAYYEAMHDIASRWLIAIRETAAAVAVAAPAPEAESTRDDDDSAAPSTDESDAADADEPAEDDSDDSDDAPAEDDDAEDVSDAPEVDDDLDAADDDEPADEDVVAPEDGEDADEDESGEPVADEDSPAGPEEGDEDAPAEAGGADGEGAGEGSSEGAEPRDSGDPQDEPVEDEDGLAEGAADSPTPEDSDASDASEELEGDGAESDAPVDDSTDEPADSDMDDETGDSEAGYDDEDSDLGEEGEYEDSDMDSDSDTDAGAEPARDARAPQPDLRSGIPGEDAVDGRSVVIVVEFEDAAEAAEDDDAEDEGPDLGDALREEAGKASMDREGEALEERAEKVAEQKIADKSADHARNDEADAMMERRHGSGKSGFSDYAARSAMEPRKPEPSERVAANRLAAMLERITFHDRVVVKRDRVLPGGKLRPRAAVAQAADRSRGGRTQVPIWRAKERHHSAETPVKVGIATDVSGSMSGNVEPSAVLTYVLSHAVSTIDGQVATATFGNAGYLINRAYERSDTVQRWKANGSYEAFRDAALLLDNELNLLDSDGARILVVFTDSEFVEPEHAAYARTFMRLCKQKNVAVIWCSYNETPCENFGHGSIVRLEGSPADIANTLGEAIVHEVSKIEAKRSA